MSQHVTVSPEEAADRLAIRELVEAYAHCADRRDAKGQMALFTEDPLRGVHERQGSNALTGVALARGARTSLRRTEQVHAATHFVGQSTHNLHARPATRHRGSLLPCASCDGRW